MTWRVTPELFRGLAGIGFASLGIPTEEDYLAAYCRHTGRGPIADWDFYIVYSLFRLAAIMQGILSRHDLAGDAGTVPRSGRHRLREPRHSDRGGLSRGLLPAHW